MYSIRNFTKRRSPNFPNFYPAPCKLIRAKKPLPFSNLFFDGQGHFGGIGQELVRKLQGHIFETVLFDPANAPFYFEDGLKVFFHLGQML
jgi:hypothetical protein